MHGLRTTTWYDELTWSPNLEWVRPSRRTPNTLSLCVNMLYLCAFIRSVNIRHSSRLHVLSFAVYRSTGSHLNGGNVLTF
jgi:hypothetical protein